MSSELGELGVYCRCRDGLWNISICQCVLCVPVDARCQPCCIPVLVTWPSPEVEF